MFHPERSCKNATDIYKSSNKGIGISRESLSCQTLEILAGMEPKFRHHMHSGLDHHRLPLLLLLSKI